MTPVKLSTILSHLKISNNIQEDFVITGVNAIHLAKCSEISFWDKKENFGNSVESSAGVLFVRKDFLGNFPKVKYLLPVENPYAMMVSFLEEFYLPTKKNEQPYVSPSAKIHPTAIVEGSVLDNAFVGPFSVIMKGTVVGENSVLESRVTLYENVSIGKNCILQAGVVIGSRGFGFFEKDGKRFPVPHIAGVFIGDNSSIGANSVVASGFLSPTTIGNNTHLDSFVQIGHNCTLGNNIYMASQCALAGSTIVEDNVDFGGAAKASGHLTIGKGAKIAAKAGVTKNVPSGIMVGGFPAEEIHSWRRGVALLRSLVKKRNLDA